VFAGAIIGQFGYRWAHLPQLVRRAACVEATIWAAAYLWLGALDSPKDAILYSLDSMTTRGASGLMLEPHWQMMGALEAANGMLLFGISTAYIFAVMQVYWSMLSDLLMARRHPR
jgi:hypothetical protein